MRRKETKNISEVLHNASIVKDKGRGIPGKHSVANKSTITGFVNDQNQRNEGLTKFDGTDFDRDLILKIIKRKK